MRPRIRSAMRPATPVELWSVVDRGVTVAGTVKDTAGEILRTRRDPARIAVRRTRAARRRLAFWSLTGLALAGVGSTGVVEVAQGEASAGSVGALVLVSGLFVYCVVGGVAAARDLATRRRAERSLPPPGPARSPVVGAVRPLMAQLDGYSDVLRASVGLIGVVPDETMRQLRDDTVAAADAAESALRAKAAQYSALVRGGSKAPELAARRDRLHGEIRVGIAEYGRLVAAASEAATASGDLAAGSTAGDLATVTDRLTALAVGMREITPQR